MNEMQNAACHWTKITTNCGRNRFGRPRYCGVANSDRKMKDADANTDFYTYVTLLRGFLRENPGAKTN